MKQAEKMATWDRNLSEKVSNPREWFWAERAFSEGIFFLNNATAGNSLTGIMLHLSKLCLVDLITLHLIEFKKMTTHNLMIYCKRKWSRELGDVKIWYRNLFPLISFT